MKYTYWPCCPPLKKQRCPRYNSGESSSSEESGVSLHYHYFQVH